ncbi:unnamed protein product [Linum trigynum]|uniref:Uncharacterized protein n=1 Tax=Linum trigynum TaxID=586398 RepID=A0AAV2DA87_9ROSI
MPPRPALHLVSSVPLHPPQKSKPSGQHRQLARRGAALHHHASSVFLFANSSRQQQSLNPAPKFGRRKSSLKTQR